MCWFGINIHNKYSELSVSFINVIIFKSGAKYSSIFLFMNGAIYMGVVPGFLSEFDFVFLISISVLTSFVTASFGVGGGAILLAIMANLLPVNAVIPVHGLVQLGSNTGRILTMRKFINWRMLLWFISGCTLGSLVGGQIAISIPKNWLQVILGCFILLICWEPLKIENVRDRSIFLLGGVTSFLAMFVGVTGIFVISTLKHIISDRRKLIGTMAAMMMFQHLSKCIVFFILGFSYGEWAWLVALMIIAGFIGTLLGRVMLNKMSNQSFGIVVKILITILAVRLLYTGIMATVYN